MGQRLRRIVNNSEDDICRLFNSAFGPLAESGLDLFPADLEPAHAELAQTI